MKIALVLLLQIILLVISSSTEELYALNNKTNQYFSSKATIQFIDQEDIQEFKAHIRYDLEDSLWVSYTGFMGIEGARMMVKSDSTFVINKMEDTYLKFSNNEQNDLIPFGLTLQEWDIILMNTPLQLANDTNINIEKIENEEILTQFLEDKIVKYFKNAKGNITKMLINKPHDNTSCEVLFDNYQKQENLDHEISFHKTINIKTPYHDLKIIIAFSHCKISSNPSSMPFSYSKNL